MSSAAPFESARIDEAVIVMTRLFDAAIDKVWDCFTQPEHVKAWFGGAGFANPFCEMDVRPGGVWRHVMRTPDGQEFKLEFVYLEVKKPTRLVWQHKDHGQRKDPPPTSRSEVTLEACGAQTRWRMVATFGSIEERDMARRMGYSQKLREGCEKFNDIVRNM